MVHRGSLCGCRCGKKMSAVKGACLDSAILNLNFIGFIYKSESLSASASGSKKEGFDADADSKRPSLGQI
jgi:hypothetical protein